MSRLKYALIGCGRRGGNHMDVISQLQDNFEIVGVCDALPEAAERAAARLGVKAYTDIRQLVAHAKPDICDVVVPYELHHAVSCYLSSQGIHHNVETGLAPTLGLMDLMISTARKHGVILQTSENFPFIPVEQFVHKLIRADVIGPVHRSYRLFSTTGYHGLAAICCRMGARPVAVSSIGHTMPVVPYVDRAKRDYNTEGFEFYAIDFDNGGMAIAMCGNKNGCLGRNNLVGFETVGERGTIITNGNQGSSGGETVNVCTDEDIAQRDAKASSYLFQREYSATQAVRRIWVELPSSLGGTIEWLNPYAETTISEGGVSVATLLDALARAIREGGEPAWPGENGRADQEMVLAAQRSIKANRQPICLPLPLDPAEEEAFDQDFIARFGTHPRGDPEKIIEISFRAR